MPTAPAFQPRWVHPTNRGRDILAYRRALNTARGPKLGGPHWPKLQAGWIYDDPMAEALDAFKRRHVDLEDERDLGPSTYKQLVHHADGFAAWLLAHAVPSVIWPVADPPHTLIGRPNQGTHKAELSGLFNWESCNALDISCTIGTPVLAVEDGLIGSQIGPLDSTDPHLLGLRLHLVAPRMEYYYAHLSRLDVHAGDQVRRGQQLGLSGSANGSPHLHFAARHGDPGLLIGSPTFGYRDANLPG